MIKYSQLNSLTKKYIKDKLKDFLEEDSPEGDVTSDLTIEDKDKSTAHMIAKEDLVFVGKDILENIFSKKVNVKVNYEDGVKVYKNSVIAEFEGNTKEILLKERIFLNLIQRLSGIASMTRDFTEIADPHGIKVLDTRKTTPGLRAFEKYAVVKGGGQNHRFNLSEGILIKDNHISACGGIKECINKLKNKKVKLPIQIEIANFEQLKKVVNLGVDGVLLDNMSPAKCREAVKIIRSNKLSKKMFIEASGGITLESLPGYVPTGIDAVSVGALTHSAKSSDISLLFVEPE